MTPAKIKKLIELINGAAERRDADHMEFLAFYEKLVTAASPAVSRAFGNMSVSVVKKCGKQEGCGLQLTPSDFLWWQELIVSGESRFANGTSSVKAEMFNRLCKSAESHAMTPAEREEFLEIMKS